MASKIRRTFYATHCYGVRKGQDGRLTPFEDTILSAVTPMQATRRLRRMYNDPSIFVEDVDVVEEHRVMTATKFRELADLEF